MDFLGSQANVLRDIKSQDIALKTLLTAIVNALPESTRHKAAENFRREAEKTRAEWLHSMATDSLYDALCEQLNDFEKMLEKDVQPH